MADYEMKRYRNIDVAVALGLSSVNRLCAFASDRKRSSRDGWTVIDIIDYLKCKRIRNPRNIADKNAVLEIRAALAAFGYSPEDYVQCSMSVDDDKEEQSNV